MLLLMSLFLKSKVDELLATTMPVRNKSQPGAAAPMILCSPYKLVINNLIPKTGYLIPVGYCF